MLRRSNTKATAPHDAAVPLRNITASIEQRLGQVEDWPLERLRGRCQTNVAGGW